MQASTRTSTQHERQQRLLSPALLSIKARRAGIKKTGRRAGGGVPVHSWLKRKANTSYGTRPTAFGEKRQDTSQCAEAVQCACMVQESGTRKSQAPVVAIHCASLPSVAPLRVGKRMVEWSVIWSIHVLVLVHGTMWCGSAAASLHSRLSASGGADGEHMPVLVHRMGARCRLFTRQAAASFVNYACGGATSLGVVVLDHLKLSRPMISPRRRPRTSRPTASPATWPSV